MVAELQAGDLRAGVDAVDPSTSGGVPEVDVTVVRTPASGEQVELPWAPAKCLDSGTMVLLGELGSVQRTCIPDGDKVVVAASSVLFQV